MDEWRAGCGAVASDRADSDNEERQCELGTVAKLTAGSLQAGRAIPIAGAKLKIAGREQSVKTTAVDRVASFRVSLKGGTKTELHGWFQDAAGVDLCGVFYASVKWLKA